MTPFPVKFPWYALLKRGGKADFLLESALLLSHAVSLSEESDQHKHGKKHDSHCLGMAASDLFKRQLGGTPGIRDLVQREGQENVYL